jgi:hypothetical protein
MNAPVTTNSFIQDCRAALIRFWGEMLTIEPAKDGAVLALPLMFPDGLQVIARVTPISATTALISDGGETLGRLAGEGMNLETAAIGELLAERLAAFEIQRDGWELRKVIALPVEGIDIQIFAEALVSIAHLIYRHEPEPASEAVAERTVSKFFAERRLTPRRHFPLEGRLERRIAIDYFLEQGAGLAVQVVGRRNQLLPYMEQWGWRWTDLRSRHPGLVRAMVYDPENQLWDETALSIGRSVCEVFCPYFETDQLAEAVEKLE